VKQIITPPSPGHSGCFPARDLPVEAQTVDADQALPVPARRAYPRKQVESRNLIIEVLSSMGKMLQCSIAILKKNGKTTVYNE
jgi:hypothetical protein